MNKKAKRRLVVVGGIVVIAMLVIVAIAGGGQAASSLSIGDVLGGGYEGKKVQVSGSVVAGSITAEGSSATFRIAPEDGDASQALTVTYDGALPATFGAGVVAVCTGTVTDGALDAAEMVTKCPSKYESAEGSITVATLLSNAGAYTGTEVKLAGYVTAGTIAGIDADVRFTVNSQGSSVDVAYDGALPDGLEDGSAVVVTGVLAEGGGLFEAADVALDSSVEAQS